jgi:hypothetical protein
LVVVKEAWFGEDGSIQIKPLFSSIVSSRSAVQDKDKNKKKGKKARVNDISFFFSYAASSFAD